LGLLWHDTGLAIYSAVAEWWGSLSSLVVVFYGACGLAVAVRFELPARFVVLWGPPSRGPHRHCAPSLIGAC
jgi:hypothetical protein